MSNVVNYFFKNFVLKEKKTILKWGMLKRRYSKITSVNVNNWNDIHREIIHKIHESDFVSIDVEYTGLHLKDERYISIDSSYEAHCYGAKSFFPCQIGITVARKNDTKEKEKRVPDGGGEKEKEQLRKMNVHNIKVARQENEKVDHKYSLKCDQEWDISPYCIYVFPKENKYFSVSTTTLIFLKENNFDFNEWICNGVGYLTPPEEEEKKKYIFEKMDELKNLMNKCSTKTEDVKKNLDDRKKKVDVGKIIQEIENYKIVDDEDKEAVIEIIKKIGIWLTRGDMAHPVGRFNQGEGDKTNSVGEDNCADGPFLHQLEDVGNPPSHHINATFQRGGTNRNNCNSVYTNYTHDCGGNEEKSATFKGNIPGSLESKSNDHVASTRINSDDIPLNSNHVDASIHGENPNDDPSDCPLYIEIENPYLRLLAHTLITKYFDGIFCISVKVNDKKHLAIYRTEKDSYKEQIKTLELEIEKINQTVGVRLLFDEIIKNKKIIIGHNCFYDILHIYQTFYHELPNSISVFKNKWTEIFPYTFDTKYLNETNEYLYALNGPATLKGLCEYMASLISASNDFDFVFNFTKGHSDLPQCFVPLVKFGDGPNGAVGNVLGTTARYASIEGENEANNDADKENNNRSDDRKKDNMYQNGVELVSPQQRSHDCHVNAKTSDEHNAGYDSLLTCLLFIFQCHYILRKNNMMWKNIYFSKTKSTNESGKSFFDIFLTMCNKIKIVKTQPNVVSLTSAENYEMARHFYMYDYPSYFKKWEIMKIWSPIWISLSKVDDQSCWIIAKSDDDAKNIKMIYKMLQNPQFKLCTYEEYMNKFKSK
ncbi:CAF1 family ribonuclease [Plasmodium coatneyi]|uniref:CAF1 family ribonuclease n=1 Tax=Plasmodium coatneyi TaxID=208452 RepID=A0A1B1E368_9APIC|nr:CAF1 family ribonuclease [Plasmodium coatneyi]ANQ09454.1 CAF1 family ribonuclease [Plasmodium coatneyi]